MKPDRWRALARISHTPSIRLWQGVAARNFEAWGLERVHHVQVYGAPEGNGACEGAERGFFGQNWFRPRRGSAGPFLRKSISTAT